MSVNVRVATAGGIHSLFCILILKSRDILPTVRGEG